MCNADINDTIDVSYVEPHSLLLKCPKCGNGLRPLLLDMFEERGESYQRVWWTCKGLKTKTCIFPLNMPPDVFWTKRTEDQMRHNVIPLPNYNLLPEELKTLYPFLMKPKTMVSKSRTVSKPTSQESEKSKKSDIQSKEAGENDVTSDAPIIERPQPSKTPEDEILEKIPLLKAKEDNFEELKVHEATRRVRKRKNKSDAPPSVWGKKQLRGVINIASVKGESPSSTLREIRKSTMRPCQERIVTGGRNFNFQMVDESIPSSPANRVQLFPDIRSSLKSALALRFAKKDYMDKINHVICDNGTMTIQKEETLKQKRQLFKLPMDAEPRPSRMSQEEDCCNVEGSETASSRSSEKLEDAMKGAFSKATEAYSVFRGAEQRQSISSRLGIRMAVDKESVSNARIKADHQEFPNELMAPLSIQSDNTLSVPSTSTLSVDSPTSVNPAIQEKVPTTFDSPELHNIVQKHLHLLRSKSEKKKKRSHVKKSAVEDHNSFSQSQHQYGEEQQQSTFDFGFSNEPDYSIFSLGNDDDMNYDVFF